MNHEELLDYIKDCADKVGSQRKLAKEIGISRAYLTQILKGIRRPGQKVLTPLGVKIVITYEKIPNGGNNCETPEELSVS